MAEARGKLIQVRVNDDEKARIRANATAAGYDDVGPFLRDLGLGSAFPTAVEEAKPEPPAPRTTAAEVDAERVDAEIAEAKLEDDPAREAFITRRAGELYAQGATTVKARWDAEVEWAARGNS